MPLGLTRFEPKHLKPALCRRHLVRPATSGEGKRAEREYQHQVSSVLIRSGIPLVGASVVLRHAPTIVVKCGIGHWYAEHQSGDSEVLGPDAAVEIIITPK
jgi:hypothetical protein